MPYETAFFKKVVTPQLSALLIPDPNPIHPRSDVEPVTTIAAWHRKFNFSDHPAPKNPEDFLLTLWDPIFPGILRELDENAQSVQDLSPVLQEKLFNSPYPGFLRKLYMHEHGNIRLTTTPFNDRFDSGWLGWIYITPKNMVIYNLNQEQALAAAEAELQKLEDYTNGEVYAVALQRPYEPDLLVGAIYSNGKGYPSEEELDEHLIERGDLSQDEQSAVLLTEWKKAVREVTWQQE